MKQDNIILHNPRCSKSRQTLALLEERGVAVDVVKYLEDAPSTSDILSICKKLGVAPLAICRTKEALFKELGLDKADDRGDAEWAQLLADNPKLIERPIVLFNGKAAVGRPPEAVLDILG